jgi:hypothetical protein
MFKVGNFHPSRTSLTTKLMIKPEYRKTTLAVRLAIATYRQGLKDGIRYDFIDANSHLINFFSGLGYRVHRTANHPEYGDVTIMVLDLEDINHLESIRSPFRKEYYNFLNSGEIDTA